MTPACEDSDVISTRIKQILAEGERSCPINQTMTLFACLRATRCPETCPVRGDWIGAENG